MGYPTHFEQNLSFPATGKELDRNDQTSIINMVDLFNFFLKFRAFPIKNPKIEIDT